MPKLALHVALVYQQNIVQDTYFDEANVTVGDQKDCNFPLDSDLLGKQFQLFEEKDGKCRLNLPKRLNATLNLSSNEFTTVDGRKKHTESENKDVQKLKIQEEDWGIIELNAKTDLVFCFETPPALLAKASGITKGTGLLLSLSQWLHSGMGVALAISFLVHAIFLFIAFWMYRDDTEVKHFELSPRWVEIVSTMEEHHEKEEEPEKEEPPIIEDEDSKIVDNSKENTNREKIDDSDSKIANLNNINKPVGIQAALGKSRYNSMESLFGSDIGLGNALDQMAETEDGDAYGTGLGLAPGIGGMRAGGGGGGGGYGGRIGGLGTGDGDGSGSGQNKLQGPSKSKAKVKPKLDLAAPTQGTFCKESNIRDVVQKRANAIRNCYEQQLLADPTLSGKIVVYWKIGLDGTVQQASIKSSTMKNAKVEACLEKTIRRLTFDQPDGGICVVEFPFIFSASN